MGKAVGSAVLAPFITHHWGRCAGEKKQGPAPSRLNHEGSIWTVTRFLGPEVTNVRHTSSVAERFPTGSLTALTPDMMSTHTRIDPQLTPTKD